MTARGRIGYSVDRFLPYLTGGFAYSSNRMKAGGGRADEGQAGYVIGVGAEVMLMQNVSARVEVLHHYYGSKSYVLPIGARSTTLTSNALRFGLNYKF
jgi:outer membrane immunogenic protein